MPASRLVWESTMTNNSLIVIMQSLLLITNPFTHLSTADPPVMDVHMA